MQLAVFLILVIAGGFLLLRVLFPARSGSTVSQSSNGVDKISRGAGDAQHNQFHAVSIHSTVEACAAAEALKRQRFISAEAPSLPLADCTAQDCHCTYAHHIDRRSGSGSRRHGSGAQAGEPAGLRERRSSDGRRQADLELVHS